MNPNRVAGYGSIALGAAIAAGAILGPMGFRMIKFRTSHNIEAQFVGGEIVSLALAAPALTSAGVMWIRGHRLAPAVAIGPALYSVYTYLTVVGGQGYGRYPGNVEKFAPLYAGLIAGSATVAAFAWRHLSEAGIAAPTSGWRRGLAALFFALGGFIALAWSAQIRLVLIGRPPVEYSEAPTLFWLIKTLDFGFVIPTMFVTGGGLLRRSPLADRAATALTSFSTCLAGSVMGMALEMEIRHDPSASAAMALIMSAATVGLGYATWRIITTTPELENRAVTPGPVELRLHG
jgi:hypothetical protein